MKRLIYSVAMWTFASLAAADSCPAQYRNPGVILSIGTSNGAHTWDGDVMRGRGAMYQGQGTLLQGMGAYQFGAGQYLESTGRYQLSNQQAQLMAEDVKLKRLETDARKQEWKRSQEEVKSQTRAIARQHKELAELSAMRDHPSVASIRSGEAPNFLLTALSERAAAVQWNVVVLTPEQLGDVRLQTASGLLPFDHADSQFDAQGRIAWPKVACDQEFDAARKQIETQLGQILSALQAGQSADKVAVSTLRQDIARLANQVPRKHSLAKNLAAAMQTRAFLNSLSDAMKQLGSDSAQQLFDGTLDFQANSVTELADHMTRHNLLFAPTSKNGVAAYTKLHEALAATHRQLSSASVASR